MILQKLHLYCLKNKQGMRIGSWGSLTLTPERVLALIEQGRTGT